MTNMAEEEAWHDAHYERLDAYDWRQPDEREVAEIEGERHE